MTCIVGLKTKDNKVILGGDSAGVAGYQHLIRDDPKVFKNGKYILGYTTSFRMGQILRHAWNPNIITNSSNPDDHMFDLIESIRDILILHKYATESSNRQDGGTFLIAWDNHLYTVFDDFQYAKNKEEFASIGCGQNYAYGSLYSSKNLLMSEKERVKLALMAASHFSGGVKPPFIFASTK